MSTPTVFTNVEQIGKLQPNYLFVKNPQIRGNKTLYDVYRPPNRITGLRSRECSVWMTRSDVKQIKSKKANMNDIIPTTRRRNLRGMPKLTGIENWDSESNEERYYAHPIRKPRPIFAP